MWRSFLLILFFVPLAFGANKTETNYTNFVNGYSPIGAIQARYCGQNWENGTAYLGASPLTSVPVDINSPQCDAMGSNEEAQAQKILTNQAKVRPVAMVCTTTADLSEGESVTFQLRTPGMDVSGASCQVQAGQTSCENGLNGFFAISPGTATSVQVTDHSDGADNKSLCVVVYAFN